jgi:hypothetical protein
MKRWIWREEDGSFKCDRASIKLRYEATTGLEIAQFAHFEEVFDVYPCPQGRKRKGVSVQSFSNGMKCDLYLLSKLDRESPLQVELIGGLRGTLDNLACRALKSGAVVFDPIVFMKAFRGASWTKTEAICGGAFGYISSISDPLEGGSYFGIAGHKLMDDIMKTSTYEPWTYYLEQGDTRWISEEGRTMGIRWVECNDPKILSTGEGIVFGENSLTMVETQTPELRFKDGKIAWFGVVAFGGQNVLHIRG